MGKLSIIMQNIKNGPISDICGCMIMMDCKAMKLIALCCISECNG